MKNSKLQKYRRSFMGTVMAIFSFLFLFGCDKGKNTDKDEIQPTVTTEVTTSCTTSTMTFTSSSSTTSFITTSTTMTTTELTMTMAIPKMTVWLNTAQIETKPIETAYVEPAPTQSNVNYSESDAVLMAQVINKESSASYEGKVAVASVILNRSNYYGQSISDVIYAPGQFAVVGYLGSYTDDDYQAAVQVLTNGSANNAYYFDGCHPDGLNHFRDINNNYIGAW